MITTIDCYSVEYKGPTHLVITHIHFNEVSPHLEYGKQTSSPMASVPLEFAEQHRAQMPFSKQYAAECDRRGRALVKY